MALNIESLKLAAHQAPAPRRSHPSASTSPPGVVGFASISLPALLVATALLFGAPTYVTASEPSESPSAASPSSPNVFEMPQKHQRHQFLAMRAQRAIRQGDAAELEDVCREGIRLLPDNPIWRYNLACALARLDQTEDALDALETAVRLGFHDADKIAEDQDLVSLRDSERFARLLEQARERTGQPPEGAGPRHPTKVLDGIALVSGTNTQWNLDRGVFQVFFAIPEEPSSEIVVDAFGDVGDTVNRWYREGKAAGNHGDYYDNRDDGHSAIDLKLFPQVTRIVYSEEARESGAHWGAANAIFNGAVVGNSSTARTSGPLWRSQARMAYTDGQQVARLVMQYLSNHMYHYPSHHDIRAPLGDVFPAHTPYLWISRGSSGSDRPFIEASFLAMAALKPEVKERLKTTRALMPTVQYLLRSSALHLLTPEDYLKPETHPSGFPPNHLSLERLIANAQSLELDSLPPLAQVRMVEEERMIQGRDFFDAHGSEMLFDTPFSISRVVRGMQYRRRYVISAEASRDPNDLPLRYHWVALQGRKDHITITPLEADDSVVEILLDYHTKFPVNEDADIESSRVDIALFAHNGFHYSPPAFITFFYLDNEQRLYHSEGRILSVDYEAARTRYVDPMISLPRHWRDDYRYTPDGQLLGWMRLGRGQVADFTPEGYRVERKDRQGRPLSARGVQYIRRTTDDSEESMPVLVEAMSNLRVFYKYDSDTNPIGVIERQETIGE